MLYSNGRVNDCFNLIRMGAGSLKCGNNAMGGAPSRLEDHLAQQRRRGHAPMHVGRPESDASSPIVRECFDFDPSLVLLFQRMDDFLQKFI